MTDKCNSQQLVLLKKLLQQSMKAMHLKILRETRDHKTDHSHLMLSAAASVCPPADYSIFSWEWTHWLRVSPCWHRNELVCMDSMLAYGQHAVHASKFCAGCRHASMPTTSTGRLRPAWLTYGSQASPTASKAGLWPARLALWLSCCWHITDIRTDTGTDTM